MAFSLFLVLSSKNSQPYVFTLTVFDLPPIFSEKLRYEIRMVYWLFSSHQLKLGGIDFFPFRILRFGDGGVLRVPEPDPKTPKTHFLGYNSHVVC